MAVTQVNRWNLYEARLNVSGLTGRDRSISRSRENIERKQLSLISRKEVEIDGASRILFIHSTDLQSEKIFNTLPGELINIGDVIYWENMHWLVTHVDFDDEVTRSGRIVQCNRQIRWQNQRTGEIIVRWCLAKKPYSTNVSDGLTIGTSTREYKIQLPCDEETMQVDLDRRFLLEVIGGVPRAYKIVSVDTITNRYEDIDGGFLVWNMEQTEYNPLVDNADFMIANYFEPGTTPDPSGPDVPPDPVPPEEPDAQKLLCKIEGRNTIREGTSRTYTAVFYGEDGVSVTDDVNAVWTVDAPTDAVTMEQDGTVLRLTYHGGMNVGDLIHISVRDDLSLYETALCDVEVIEFL